MLNERDSSPVQYHYDFNARSGTTKEAEQEKRCFFILKYLFDLASTNIFYIFLLVLSTHNYTTNDDGTNKILLVDRIQTVDCSSFIITTSTTETNNTGHRIKIIPNTTNYHIPFKNLDLAKIRLNSMQSMVNDFLSSK